jgi:hypothetical protein
MIPTSLTPIRRTPPWHYDAETKQPKPGAPVYLLKPGDVVAQGLFEAELSSPPFNAGKVLEDEFFDEAVAAMKAWTSGPDLERHLEVIAAARAKRIEENTPEAQHLAGIEEVLLGQPGWPAYKALFARKARRNEFLPLLALMTQLVGWENREATFSAGLDGRVTGEALATIPPLERRWLGFEAWAILHLKADLVPLFGPGSTSERDPKSSTSGGPTRGKDRGSSTGKSGRRTRGSSSRRRSSRQSTSG